MFQKDKAGQLKYVYEDGYSDIITRYRARLRKTVMKTKKVWT
jgi:hypothetical protein